MQSKRETAKALTLSIMAIAMASAFLVCPTGVDAAEGGTVYDVDYGRFYSYQLQFVFDGSDAESITWDFGDGTPVSDEWNPTHVYAEKGVYHVTQTTTNSFNGGSTTVEVYRVEIMGYPVITFVTDGPAIEPIRMTGYNEPVPEPEHPVRDGYTFGGWYTDATCSTAFDWTQSIRMPTEVHVRWIPIDPEVPVTHRVVFDTSGGTVIPYQTVVSGSMATEPDEPTRDGYTFGGWFSDPGCTQAYLFDAPVASDITIHAKWTLTDPVPGKEEFVISFDVNGGSVTVDSIVSVEGSTVVIPGYPGVRDGHTFGGWMLDDEVHQPGDRIVVDRDMSFTAVWTVDDPTSGEEGPNVMDAFHVVLVVVGAICLVALVVGARRH